MSTATLRQHNMRQKRNSIGGVSRATLFPQFHHCPSVQTTRTPCVQAATRRNADIPIARTTQWLGRSTPSARKARVSPTILSQKSKRAQSTSSVAARGRCQHMRAPMLLSPWSVNSGKILSGPWLRLAFVTRGAQQTCCGTHAAARFLCREQN